MNLREAIEAGSTRVDGRCTGVLISYSGETGALRACAMGAAYLGCNPDVDLTPPDDVYDRYKWAGSLREAASRWIRGLSADDRMKSAQVSAVYAVNDNRVPWSAGWDTLLAHPGFAQLADVEVCDESA
jgi:hypothetical protein